MAFIYLFSYFIFKHIYVRKVVSAHRDHEASTSPLFLPMRNYIIHIQNQIKSKMYLLDQLRISQIW